MWCTIEAIVLGPVNNYVPVATLVKVLLNWPLVTYLRSAVKSIIFKVKFSPTVSCTVSDFLHRRSQKLHITIVSFRVLWWSEFLFDIWCWFLTYFFAQARVSLKRIQEFLDREELDPNSVQKTRCKFTLSSLILTLCVVTWAAILHAHKRMRIANQMSSVPNLPFFLLLNISTVILLVCFHLTDERATALLFKKFEKWPLRTAIFFGCHNVSNSDKSSWLMFVWRNPWHLRNKRFF